MAVVLSLSVVLGRSYRFRLLRCRLHKISLTFSTRRLKNTGLVTLLWLSVHTPTHHRLQRPPPLLWLLCYHHPPLSRTRAGSHFPLRLPHLSLGLPRGGRPPPAPINTLHGSLSSLLRPVRCSWCHCGINEGQVISQNFFRRVFPFMLLFQDWILIHVFCIRWCSRVRVVFARVFWWERERASCHRE